MRVPFYLLLGVRSPLVHCPEYSLVPATVGCACGHLQGHRFSGMPTRDSGHDALYPPSSPGLARENESVHLRVVTSQRTNARRRCSAAVNCLSCLAVDPKIKCLFPRDAQRASREAPRYVSERPCGFPRDFLMDAFSSSLCHVPLHTKRLPGAQTCSRLSQSVARPPGQASAYPDRSRYNTRNRSARAAGTVARPSAQPSR